MLWRIGSFPILVCLTGYDSQQPSIFRQNQDQHATFASSTKSFATSKRLILQLPTVTPSSTRLWLSIPVVLG